MPPAALTRARLAQVATVLDRELFTEAEAARHLAVAQGTLHYWLEGGVRRGKTYLPVIRDVAADRRSVTWAEFVEAGLLRQYRREHNVPMGELRAFIGALREHYEIPYPLAHAKPFVAGRELIWNLQEEFKLDADFCLVAEVRGQFVLTPASESFFSRVEWRDDVAAAWRPDADPESPVLIDPERRFGRPSVGGISTETIWEHIEGGESEEEVAEDFGIGRSAVAWALRYESPRRAA